MVCMVNYCWMLTPDHYLDDRLSLSRVSRRRRLGAIHNVHSWMARSRMRGQWRKSPKLRQRRIVQKKHFAPSPIWRSLKISPPKVEKPTYETELYHQANFHADPREISVPRAKIHIFLIGDSLGEGATAHVAHFWKALVEPIITPHLTCNAATYRLRDIRGQNLGFWGPLGLPQKETLCPGPIYHRVKFHADRCHHHRDICNQTDRCTELQQT